MRLLLDTHLLLWTVFGDPQLPAKARQMIDDSQNQLVFSSVNIWEVVIESGLQRADFNVNPHRLRTGLLENGYTELPVTGVHALAVASLPNLHKDPFDRLLIAQATAEGMTLLTTDPFVASYPGPVIAV